MSAWRQGWSAVGVAALLGVVAPPGLDAAPRVPSLQEVVLRAKPATVLVVAEVASEVSLNCGSGPRQVAPPPFRETGTGWFVDSNGWVVTNGHVVQPAHELPPWVGNEQARKAIMQACVWEELAKQGISPGQRPDLEEPLRQRAIARAWSTARVALKPSVFILIANGFRLPAKVEKYSPPVSTQPGTMSGRDLALLYVEAAEMPAFKLAESKTAKIGDPIRILGYPGVVLTHELLNSTAKVEASVTNGAISGLKQDVQNQPVIQTDAPAAWGNSGGPAIDAHGDVIGVLTFVSLAPDAGGALVQGFNFIIPSDAVKEFLRGAPVDLNDQSPFNQHWFVGLEKFFRDDFKGATEAIRKADRLQPEFPDLRRMLAEAEDNIKNPPPRPFPWYWPTGVVAAAGVIVAAGVVGWRLRRNRSRVTPEEAVRLLGRDPAPVLLDVRTPVMYQASAVRLPGARYVSPESVAASPAMLGLDPGRTVITYCTSDGDRTSMAVAIRLRAAGFSDVRVLRGGLGAWASAGLPLEPRPADAPTQ